MINYIFFAQTKVILCTSSSCVCYSKVVWFCYATLNKKSLFTLYLPVRRIWKLNTVVKKIDQPVLRLQHLQLCPYEHTQPQPPIQSTGSVPGINWPESGVNRSPPSSSEVEERVKLYIYFLSVVMATCRVNFTPPCTCKYAERHSERKCK